MTSPGNWDKSYKEQADFPGHWKQVFTPLDNGNQKVSRELAENIKVQEHIEKIT